MGSTGLYTLLVCIATASFVFLEGKMCKFMKNSSMKKKYYQNQSRKTNSLPYKSLLFTLGIISM